MPKKWHYSPKGDNLEPLKHFKSHLGPNRIDFFWLIFVPYQKVTTNSVINKIYNE